MSIYHVADPRFHELVVADAAFETLAEGFRFTEGAAWHPDERHVTFSDIPSSRIHRWDAASGETAVLRDPSNMTNGTCYDAQGRLLMCEHETSRVSRLEADGSISVLADSWQGSELNSPNDIVVDDHGNIWFTDPLYGRDSHTGVEREPGLPFRGVFRIDHQGTLHLLDDDYIGPNGLCFSPDKSRLYVNDSERVHIRLYHVGADGSATGGEVFAETRDVGGFDDNGSPDGMKVDARGNVWCAGPGGIHVFDPEGALLGIVLTPQFPANFCFGGDDMCDLFVNAGTTFVRLRLAQPGHPAFNP
ncbi:MAG: SMP-30/gluconolactonase/LRE family protein [Alphaproteobacteria bacterium]|jgi:gluconolactonase|nr:SMP-30/gluconolactonase/LRE family protein [Rhodospirillaceae bacterium]MDG2482398.1 SMP-30/gluconolactonase/LRE family protein [Alphaproteobacteria bacterium]MBT6202191.1 SMP-30/gluconolactonase/LRE family protein [Rhodospirillaceae bacterium]MBT6511645.1 SMP-30/gluconolactonase/LRE family protein [Rhodospirillaceae bacterium]MBT7612622.1 SMP-30/gluconolactonase/LRE family protein [Rhodospirillaceae bacterium]